jgi:hypothetical protein
MATLNPYAPSRASLTATDRTSATDDNAVWRDGNVLITLVNAEMPHRCIKCNEPADEPTKNRKVYWHHSTLYLLILINALIYAIVALAVRKKAIVNAGLCTEHKKRRRNALIFGWTGTLVGIVLMSYGLGSGGSGGGSEALVGILLILASIIAGMIFARVVYAKKIDKTYVRLKGCGAAFLDSLPQFTGEAG